MPLKILRTAVTVRPCIFSRRTSVSSFLYLRLSSKLSLIRLEYRQIAEAMYRSRFTAIVVALVTSIAALSVRSSSLAPRARFCMPTNSSSSSLTGLFSLAAADTTNNTHSTKPTHFMYFPPPSSAATPDNSDVLVLSKKHYKTIFNLTNGKLTTPNVMSCLIYFEDLSQGTPVVCGAFPNPKSMARNQTWRAENQCLFNILTKVLVPVVQWRGLSSA